MSRGAHHHLGLLDRVAGLLAPHDDVIAGRVHEAAAPTWATERGWQTWLAALDDAALARAECSGLGAALDERTPASLRALCREAHALTQAFVGGTDDLPPLETIGVPLRKRAQVAALVEYCRTQLPGLTRIVDLGAGHGHLTRALSRGLGVMAVGVDHDPELISQARAVAPEIRYLVADERFAVALEPSDLLIGLHACGSLGDALVVRGAEARCHVLLVSCCMQKIAGAERHALSERGRHHGLSLPRDALGMTNLAWGTATRRAMGARQVRHALRRLLRMRGVEEPPGQEARGIHKRRFLRGLGEVAQLALKRRGLAPASAIELAEADRRAADEYACVRRFSLPRAMLGRAVELMVVLDRGVYLAERGHRVRFGPMFGIEVSPRNLGLMALAPT